jgi:hypothetical protein
MTIACRLCYKHVTMLVRKNRTFSTAGNLARLLFDGTEVLERHLLRSLLRMMVEQVRNYFAGKIDHHFSASAFGVPL